LYLLQFPILHRVQYKNVGVYFFGQKYVQTVLRLRFSPFTGEEKERKKPEAKDKESAVIWKKEGKSKRKRRKGKRGKSEKR